MKANCLSGALSRKEPTGVWGGELFEDGRVIAEKRAPGRPRINAIIEIEEVKEVA
jgi:WhiB family redox-sensing transcriptional regulator